MSFTTSVAAVKFGVLSPDSIRKLSVAQIQTPDTYDEDGVPIPTGVMDPRLGTLEPGQRCRTCGNTYLGCPGHFGHIELPVPVIHEGFVKIILKLLRTTCRSCGRILLSDDQASLFREEIETLKKENKPTAQVFYEIKQKAMAAGICSHCGEKQLKLDLEKPTTTIEITDSGPVALSPNVVRARLERITDEDLVLLDVDPVEARPEWMVLQVLPVPPVYVRPSITLESGFRSEDDLTHKLVDILRVAQRLKENIAAGSPSPVVAELSDLLQYHVTTYFNNEALGTSPSTHRSGRILKTLAQRLKGKEGRFRLNLSGKRVDFSSRTVISPDPNLSINEVGVPERIAQQLTVPVTVTAWNIEKMRQYVRSGPDRYPGARYVIRPDGKRIRLRFVSDLEELAAALEPGFVVERHLQDGDIVLFNRQPSLHRMSIMAHVVKVLPYKTFRLNLCVCVSPDTRVMVDGASRPIEQLRNCWKESRVNTYDWSGAKRMTVTPLKAFWGLKPKDYEVDCFRIETRSGREIQATADHPFYTGRGVIPAVRLEPGDKVVVYPNNFPEYEEVDRQILSEDDVIRHAPKETYIHHTLDELRRRNLAPINLHNNPLAQILARLVGHIFGDGTLILKGDVARVVFRGTETDLEDIQRDLRTLGFEPEGIRSEKHEAEIVSASGKVLRFKGEGKSFEVRSKPLAILLKALGAPAGDRVKARYLIPGWIKNAPKYIRKEFLSSYFGSELTRPALRKNSRKDFKEPTFKISKVTSRIRDGKRLAGEFKELLEGFGVRVTSVRVYPGNIRKDGLKTKVTTVSLSSSLESMLNLLGSVGYSYNRGADVLARRAYEYYRYKKMGLQQMAASFKLVKELFRNGVSVAEAARRAAVPYNTAYDWVRRKKKAGLSTSFASFEEFVRVNCTGLEDRLVYDVVKAVERTELPYVYDVTTVAESHNFVANEFLTGNCPPYNADFDGDEMNLHVPQSEEARVEARVLLLVQNNMLSPRFGGPIIGAIRDFITAIFLLTSKNTLLDKKDTSILVSSVGYKGDLPEPVVKKPEPTWSGKQIFSLMLPEGFNHRFKSSYCVKCKTCLEGDCPYDQYVIIENGQLLTGVIDRNAVGVERTDSILHRVAREHGFDAAKSFLDKISRMATAYLAIRGFTFSLSDVQVEEKVYRDISKVFSNMDESFLSLVEKYRKGEIQRQPGETLQESLESTILSLLSESRNSAGRFVAKSVPEDSSAVIMTRTGARGTSLNIDQMIATVGQQAVRRERIKRGYGERVLSFFEPGDLSPSARGFIYNSFVRGLDPIEFFFHAVGGRDGLVDTAVRTQQSGYMQRRLINALESLYVEYDGTVRAADDDKIVQYKYGEDGVDPAKSYHGRPVNVGLLVEKAQVAARAAEPASDDYLKSQVDSIKDELPTSVTETLAKSLLESKASRTVVKSVLKQVVEDYRKSKVEPGDPVGVVTAQSIGEPGTQMTLRTFHFAGVREQSILLGLPRLIEIVDARKTPSTPQMKIYLGPEHRRDRGKAESLAKQLTYMTMREILSEYAIDLDRNAVLLRLDDQLMQENEITVEKIKEALQRYQTEIRGRNVIVRSPEVSLEALEKLRDRVLLQRVKGIRRITRTMLTRESGEYVIYTEGSNLKEVIQTPGVDVTRVETNDVQEIASVLGIEAARHAIIDEARQVLREQGMDVDIRHLLLLADVMTASGKVKQVGRHGVVKLKSSVLARAAFEISVQTLLDAAAKGEVDPLRGNVERILVGKEIPVGTGKVDMLMSPPVNLAAANAEG